MKLEWYERFQMIMGGEYQRDNDFRRWRSRHCSVVPTSLTASVYMRTEAERVYAYVHLAEMLSGWYLCCMNVRGS